MLVIGSSEDELSCEEAAEADLEDPALFFERVALLVELVSQFNR